jgi:hypothetical protein
MYMLTAVILLSAVVRLMRCMNESGIGGWLMKAMKLALALAQGGQGDAAFLQTGTRLEPNTPYHDAPLCSDIINDLEKRKNCKENPVIELA